MNNLKKWGLSSVVLGLCLGSLLFSLGSGCQTKRATASECLMIFNKIIALELKERGINDPALLALKQAELSKKFATALANCPGKRLPRQALECLNKVNNSEELSHHCLAF